MYACTFVCIYPSMYVCMYVCVRLYMHACMYVCVRLSMYVSTYVYMQLELAHLHNLDLNPNTWDVGYVRYDHLHPCTHTPMHPCTHTPMHPCNHTPVHPHAHMRRCTYEPMHPCTHEPIRIYIRITHAYTLRYVRCDYLRNISTSSGKHLTGKDIPPLPWKRPAKLCVILTLALALTLTLTLTLNLNLALTLRITPSTLTGREGGRIKRKGIST